MFKPELHAVLALLSNVIPHSKVDAVTHPFATLLRAEAPFAFDLHVLGTPPALILSQDQTLKLSNERAIRLSTTMPFCLVFDGSPASPGEDSRLRFGSLAPPARPARRAGLLHPATTPPRRPKPPRRRRGKSGVVRVYLVFKEPRPRRLPPSGVPVATTASGRAAHQGQTFKLTLRLPALSTLFSSTVLRRVVRPPSHGQRRRMGRVDLPTHQSIFPAVALGASRQLLVQRGP